MISRISLLLAGALMGFFLSLSLGVSTASIAENDSPPALGGVAPIESVLPDPATLTVEERYELSATMLKLTLRGVRHMKFHLHFDPSDGGISIHADESHGLPSPYPAPKPAPKKGTSEAF